MPAAGSSRITQTPIRRHPGSATTTHSPFAPRCPVGETVPDVDRAKAFYVEQPGFVIDVDVRPADGVRVV
jgi:hypothetical protein